MKTKRIMRKLILSLIIILISYVSFGQATPTSDIRMVNATTPFGVNLPIGTKVYNIATKIWYTANAGISSDKTITTAISANLLDATGSGTVTSVAALTLGTTGSDLSSTVATGTTTPVITLNVPTASSTARGALSSTDWTKFNKAGDSVATPGWISKYTIDAAGDIIIGTGNNTYGRIGIGTSNQVLTSNGTTATWATVADGSASNEGALTVVAGGANDSQIHSNTSGSTDVTISGGTGISVTESGSTITIATTGLKIAKVEDLEVATSDSAAANRYIWTLAQTPAAGTISVQINGMSLKPTTQYTIVQTNKLRMAMPLYQYDQVSVSYSY